MTARHRFRTFCGSLLALWLACAMHPGKALCEAITPFQTQNQSPTALIFGLPAAGDATILGRREFGGILALDIANNFAQSANSREQILLDGESYRANLGVSYGIAKGFEAGIEIPFIGIGGGIFDSFIKGWHRFFGLPPRSLPEAPNNRLLYSYKKDGQTLLLLNDSGSGLGDIRLSGGVQLYIDEQANPRQLALRASVKLPTGSSSNLLGSGSTDFALWLTAADDYRLPALGHVTLFGAAGGMAMTDGNVLKNQQRRISPGSGPSALAGGRHAGSISRPRSPAIRHSSREATFQNWGTPLCSSLSAGQSISPGKRHSTSGFPKTSPDTPPPTSACIWPCASGFNPGTSGETGLYKNG